METPQKRQKSKRMITTAATDKNDTIFLTVQDERKSRIYTQIHHELSSTKKRLNFDTEKEKIYALKTKNQAKI